jgi:hypothetical protein
MSLFHRGTHELEMVREEHGHTGGTDEGVPGKKVLVLEDTPTSPYQLNPTITLSYNAAGDVVKIEKVISGVTYTKTISRDDEVIVKTTTISEWS